MQGVIVCALLAFLCVQAFSAVTYLGRIARTLEKLLKAEAIRRGEGFGEG